MSMYTPDSWVLLHVVGGSSPHYRVFGSWSGGYLDGDSWRMNSGVCSANQILGGKVQFHGSSGSIYECSLSNYGIRSPYNLSELNTRLAFWNNHQENVYVVDEMPVNELLKLNWGIEPNA